MKQYQRVVLLIMDGFGVASKNRGNAITLAGMTNLDNVLANYPATTIQASGPLVGLPWGEMGNSEVGHLNIGAGRIVSQDLPRITASIQDGEFFRNPVFVEACDHVKKNNSKLHLLGMVSPGGVHSYDEHLYALLGLAAEQGIRNAFIHMITDGRDTEQKVALASLEKMHTKIQQIGVGKVATIAGRFYAMDRGQHWDQTEMMYQAMVNGIGETSNSPLDCIASNYAKGIYDEMIKPTVIMEGGAPVAKVEANDAIIFFNFRQDRAIQLTIAFVDPDRMKIEPKHPKLDNLYFVTMTSYLDDLAVRVAFPPLKIENYLSYMVSWAGMKQFHVAESEKFAHVTSFFNAGKIDPLPGEDRLIISSPDNSNNYSDQPEMSAERITDVIVEQLEKTDVNFIVANFANADMVGHTGNLEATIRAMKFIDLQLARIVDAVLKADACLLITADHGNAEQLIYTNSGDINKDHTTAPVPLILVGNEFRRPQPAKFNYESLASIMPEGALSDIAPTVLELFALPKPDQMTGISMMPILMASLKNGSAGEPVKSGDVNVNVMPPPPKPGIT